MLAEEGHRDWDADEDENEQADGQAEEVGKVLFGCGVRLKGHYGV